MRLSIIWPPLQDECVRALLDPVNKDGLTDMSGRLLAQINVGLEKENHEGEVKMLITYVYDLPDGKEEGEFLALDLGTYMYNSPVPRIQCLGMSPLSPS